MKTRFGKKYIVLAVIMLFFEASAISSISGSLTNNGKIQEFVSLSSEWRYPPDIIVPDNYSTIQQAVDNANQGFCIGVRNGTYNEKISINKNDLILEGDLTAKTIIDNGNNNNSIMIRATNITITDFDFIFNATYSGTLDNQVIKIKGENCRIMNNNISGYKSANHSLTGIYATKSDYITITGNKIWTPMDTDEIMTIGIYLEGCNMYNISFNKIYHCNNGLLLFICMGTGEFNWNFMGILNNKITQNYIGINLEGADWNIQITQNEISNNTYGIISGVRSIPIISYNNILNNNISLIFTRSLGDVQYNNIINESANKLVQMIYGNLVLAPHNYWGKQTDPEIKSPRNKILPFFGLIILLPWRIIPVPIEQTWPD